MLLCRLVRDSSVLICSDLTKEFKESRAIDSLSFEIPENTIFGLLGPNGSGKTTTIRISLGVFGADSGWVELLGSREPLSVRSRVGYLPEERGLYPKMKVLEQLAFLGTIRGLPQTEANLRAADWLDRLKLADRKDALTNELSKGMQQKVQFASSVIHEPELVILDEPFSGLDPVNSRLLKDLILEQRTRGATVVLSTHRMEQVEAMCESICLIHRGRSVLFGKLSEIKASYGKSVIAIEYEGDTDALNAVAGIQEFQDSGRSARLQIEPGADTQTILKELLEKVRITAFRQEEPHIEDIFLDKVSDPGEARSDLSNPPGEPR